MTLFIVTLFVVLAVILICGCVYSFRKSRKRAVEHVECTENLWIPEPASGPSEQIATSLSEHVTPRKLGRPPTSPQGRRRGRPFLPDGALAPDFEIRLMGGGRRRLSHWQGQRVLLIFIQPECAASEIVLRRLATLAEDSRSGEPAPLLVSVSHERENVQVMDRYGIRFHVLLQDDIEVAEAYKVRRTPSAYRIDERGRIEGEGARGITDVLALIGLPAVADEADPDPEPSVLESGGARLHRLTQRDKRKITWSRLESSVAGYHGPRLGTAEPLVSVVIATANRPWFLAEVLRCYEEQTYRRRELIVVDDGNEAPADAAAIEAVAGLLIRVEPGTPLGEKLNRGISAAHGRLCQKWDDDDWYAPNFLETMVAAYIAHEAATSRPCLVFVCPVLFFDIKRWELRFGEDGPSGGTLLFDREFWKHWPFIPSKTTEDTQFAADHLSHGASLVRVPQSRIYAQIRHTGLPGNAGHAWTHWTGESTVEDYLLGRPLTNVKPESLFPENLVAQYRDLRAMLNPERISALDEAPSRPRVLLVTPDTPSLSNNGLSIRAGMTVKALAQTHDVYVLVVQVCDPCVPSLPEEISELCRQCVVLTRRQAQTDRPYQDISFDLVHVLRLWMYRHARPYIEVPHRPEVHIDMDDFESQKHLKFAARCRSEGDGAGELIELQKARAFEGAQGRILPTVDRVYMSSRRDAAEIGSKYGLTNVCVLPNVVPVPPEEWPLPTGDPFIFLFIGNLAYGPNQEGILYFCREILPLVRCNARREFAVAIAGSGAGLEVRSLEDQPEVQLLGFVPDVASWYHRAGTVIVPILAGGGTRVKAIEAMSHRRPVVTTTFGIEGLDLRANVDALVGDTPHDFAAQCLRLMEDRELAVSVAENAYSTYLRAYTPEAAIRAITTGRPQSNSGVQPGVTLQTSSKPRRKERCESEERKAAGDLSGGRNESWLRR